jgi:hypothetical protein
MSSARIDPRFELGLLSKKPIKYILTDDPATFLLRMGLLKRFNTDFPEIVRHSGNQRAGINELRHPVQQFRKGGRKGGRSCRTFIALL